jgi:hypothetical protein
MSRSILPVDSGSFRIMGCARLRDPRRACDDVRASSGCAAITFAAPLRQT